MASQFLCIISDNEELKEFTLRYAQEQQLPLAPDHIYHFATADAFQSHFAALTGILIVDSEKEIDSVLALCRNSNFCMEIILLTEKAARGDLFSQALPFLQIQKPALLVDVMEAVKKVTERLSKENPFVTIGDHQFSFKQGVLQNGKSRFSLTEKEASLIMVLYENYPNALSKKELLKKVWDYDITMDTHTLETHIYRLRQKINNGNSFLQTKAEGYVLGGMR